MRRAPTTAAVFAVLTGLGAALAAVPASAQTLSDEDKAEIRSLPNLSDAAGPAASDSKVSQGSAVSITGGQGDKNVSLEASVRLRNSPGVSQFLTFKAKAPLDEDLDVTQIATLDGLANATTFEAKYTMSYFNSPGGPPDEAALDRLCKKVADRFAMAQYKDKRRKEFSCDADTLDFDGSDALAVGLHDEYRDLSVGPRDTVGLLGFSGKIGRKTYKYVDPTSLADKSDEDTPWSVGAFLGAAYLRANTLVALSIEHQHARKDADKLTLCPVPPAGSTTPVTCATGAIGAPVANDKDNLSLELRHRATWFAAAVTATYDFKNDVLGVSVPVYLVDDGKNGLAGGVRFGWTNEKDDFTVGVFASKAFDLFAMVR